MNLTQLTNEIVEESEQPYLIDYVGANEPLVISFGALWSEGKRPFEFYKRLKKLEALSGKKINKILLRDKTDSWYHYGLEGMGKNADELAAKLKEIITAIQPSKVIIIGQSMGAFGAVLFGTLLNADKVICFGPLAVFDHVSRNLFFDIRWKEMTDKVEAAPPLVFYKNLPQLIRDLKPKTRFEIFYGTKPADSNAVRSEAVNYDAVHAMLFYGLPNTFLYPVYNSYHHVINYLKSSSVIDDFLMYKILDIKTPVDDYANIGISPEMVDWVEHNYKRGFENEVLLKQVNGAISNEIMEPAITRIKSNILKAALDF